jgi:hypothetical protein
VLRGILGPKMKEVGEGWRNFHYEEIRDLYGAKILLKC